MRPEAAEIAAGVSRGACTDEEKERVTADAEGIDPTIVGGCEGGIEGVALLTFVGVASSASMGCDVSSAGANEVLGGATVPSGEGSVEAGGAIEISALVESAFAGGSGRCSSLEQ